jgi:hypothetical protein
MKRRKMTAKQLKYFGKRRKTVVRVVHSKRRKTIMAKRKYHSYAKRGIGGMKGMVAPIVGGIADNVIDGALPVQGVGSTVTGIFLHNETLKTIGLYKVGYSLGNILPIPHLGNGTAQGGLL